MEQVLGEKEGGMEREKIYVFNEDLRTRKYQSESRVESSSIDIYLLIVSLDSLGILVKTDIWAADEESCSE